MMLRCKAADKMRPFVACEDDLMSRAEVHVRESVGGRGLFNTAKSRGTGEAGPFPSPSRSRAEFHRLALTD